MKKIIALTLGLLTTSSLLAADANPADKLKDALAKLKAATNYSWAVKLEQPGMEFMAGPIKGQAEKDGYALVTQDMNDNKVQAVFKGAKTAVKLQDQWQLLDQVQGFEAIMGWMLARTKTAAEEAGTLLSRVKELKAGEGGLFSGDLTDEGAKAMFSFAPPGGGADMPMPMPEVKNAKASVKFWLKDGALSKFESHVKGSMSFGPDQDARDLETTRTVEIQAVGTTKVEVPDAAKKILDAK